MPNAVAAPHPCGVCDDYSSSCRQGDGCTVHNRGARSIFFGQNREELGDTSARNISQTWNDAHRHEPNGGFSACSPRKWNQLLKVAGCIDCSVVIGCGAGSSFSDGSGDFKSGRCAKMGLYFKISKSFLYRSYVSLRVSWS